MTEMGQRDSPVLAFECRIGQVADGPSARSRGALAQLVARFHGMEEVRGSSPLSSTLSSTLQALVRRPLVMMLEAVWRVGLASAYQSAYQRPRAVGREHPSLPASFRILPF